MDSALTAHCMVLYLVRKLNLSIVAASWLALSLTTVVFASPVARQTENGFESLLKSEELAHAKIESAISETLTSLVKTSPLVGSDATFTADFEIRESQIEDLRSELDENHLRIEFLTSLFSATDKSIDLRNDTIKILVDLAQKQIMASSEANARSNVWKFEVYLAIALRDCLEPNENLAEFTKKYILYSTLSNPKSPLPFCKKRDYLGG